MRSKTPNGHKYWWDEYKDEQRVFYVKERGYVAAGMFGIPISILLFTLEIWMLEGPPQILAPLGTLVILFFAWGLLAEKLCRRAKPVNHCVGFHPFSFFHKNIRILGGQDILQNNMQHSVYKEAVEEFIDSAAKNHDNTPWTKWSKTFKDLNEAMDERRKILTKQQEAVTLSNYAESIRLENKMLSGEDV